MISQMTGFTMSKVPKSIGNMEVGQNKQKYLNKLKIESQEFESLFLSHLLNKMSESALKSDFMGESSTQSIFKEMYHQELARTMSSAGGIGIGNMLYKQLSKYV